MNEENEKIFSESEEELDEQKIVSGKAYKVLFDYTGRVSEIGFTDNYYNLEENEDIGADVMSDDEKVNYSRLVNLLDTSTLSTRDYMYDTDGMSFNRKDLNISENFSGFRIEKVESNGTTSYVWSDITSDVTDDTFSLGNPYSRTSQKNYILSLKNSSTSGASTIKRIDSRQNINNSYFFPYMVEPDSETLSLMRERIPGYLLYLSTIYGAGGSISRISFNELEVIKAHYTEVSGIMKSAISNLRTQSCGMFLGLSKFTPNISSVSNTSVSINGYESVNNEEFTLFGYNASSRLLKVRNNNIFLDRRSLYSNNIISSYEFDNPSDWIISGADTYEYVPDTLWGQGKDVFCIYPSISSGEGTVDIKYNTGDMAINSMYEVAINIEDSYDSSTESGGQAHIKSVTAIFHSGNEEVYELTLDNTYVVYDDESSMRWVNYSAETSETVIADCISYRIEFTTTGTTGNFCITKPVVRK